MMTTLKEFLLSEEEKLAMYTGAIAKVHSRLHPEVHEVKALYEDILSEVKQDEKSAGLRKAFDRLVELTNNFEIPADTCETFAAVYQDLATANQLFRAAH